MSYWKMKKKIANLEGYINDVDYPASVMKQKPWTMSYMKDLYQRSVNGARSPKAIKHLKNVCACVYAEIAAVIVIIIAIGTVIAILSSKK